MFKILKNAPSVHETTNQIIWLNTINLLDQSKIKFDTLTHAERVEKAEQTRKADESPEPEETKQPSPLPLPSQSPPTYKYFTDLWCTEIPRNTTRYMLLLTRMFLGDDKPNTKIGILVNCSTFKMYILPSSFCVESSLYKSTVVECWVHTRPDGTGYVLVTDCTVLRGVHQSDHLHERLDALRTVVPMLNANVTYAIKHDRDEWFKFEECREYQKFPQIQFAPRDCVLNKLLISHSQSRCKYVF